jgi:hypothetical protein
VGIARTASGVVGVSALAYMFAAIVQLDRLTYGRPLDVFLREAFRSTDSRPEHLLVSTALCAVVVATVVPFGLLIARVGPRLRVATIVVCLGVLGALPLIMAVDMPTVLRDDNVFRGDPDFGRTLVTSWFPTIHYVALTAVLLGMIVLLVALANSDARDYFRRRHQVAEDDPRIWSVSRLRRPDDPQPGA